MKSSLEKTKETLLSSVQKNKASILMNNEALKKAHRRTRGTLQQIEEIRHMLKSFKLRMSGIRERHLNANKDKFRNLIHRCNSFKIKQGLEVDNTITQSKGADFHIISKLFYQNASSLIAIDDDPKPHRKLTLLNFFGNYSLFVFAQERRIRAKVEKESASDNKNRAELQALLESFQSDL